jgi:cytochrome c
MRNLLSKTSAAVAIGAVSLALSGTALASPELAQKSGCNTCHDVSTKKMGPSFKEIASKNKGKADAEKSIVAKLKSGQGHPKVNASDADITALAKWVLAM